MTNEQKISKIIEWLFVNDRNCASAKDWRIKLIAEIRNVLGEDLVGSSIGTGGWTTTTVPSLNHQRGVTGVITPLCNCNQATRSHSCPVHHQ